MSFQNLVEAARGYFPKLKIKYKDQSWIMRLLGRFLFFNHDFMKLYSTTVGETIYFPNERFIKSHPVSASVVLLHELVHLHDQRRIGKPLFVLSYVFPQIIVPICLLLCFCISWKIMLPLSLVFCVPIPAVFRMYWEKRAYLSSLYMMQLLANRLHFNPHLKLQERVFLRYFTGPSYYFMWPFHNINKQFDQAVENSSNSKRPFQDSVFDMLEDLVTKV